MTRGPLYTRVLVDAGPLAAICDPNDQYHDECVETLKIIAPPLLTSWLVIAEAAHLVRKSVMSVEQLLAGPTRGLYQILPLESGDLPGMAALVRRYRKLGPQVTDISLVHLAGREGLAMVFTLDRRDFSVYRTLARKSLQLLPEKFWRHR